MANYFQSSKNSELSELQIDLNSMNLDVKKEAAKQVIAMMTIGKDVSSLFPHMVKCMETNSIELKKLVYLYIINYAKSKADLAIMAVNSFQKDAREKGSPLLRALSLRTMGCIRIEKITQEFLESLKSGLQDYDPYVKKTAAIAVAKLYSISPKMVLDQDLVKLLQGLLQDGNAIVVANACASLLEISNSTGKNYFKFGKNNGLQKILSAVNESNEWGQIFILEAISTYDPKNSDEADQICERIMPRLAHNNPAVLLSSVKVLLKNIDYLKDEKSRQTILKKLSAPLISLIACEPELQYVALRNISFILQKQPSIFENNIKVFFIKFNDPVYVKLEKVDILVRVADQNTCEQILLEFKEYSQDVDMELVGAAVKAIGQIVLKIESSAKTAASCIHDIVKNGQTLALQEAVIVAKDILRKFPGKYESMIDDLVKKVDEYYEVDAKASIAWIVGEYAEKIKTSQKIIQDFAAQFLEEPDPVKLQILTACVKLFLKMPDKSETLIQDLLKKATEEVDNPDLRDRAYIYWRMLSTSPEKAAQVVLGKRPNIEKQTGESYPQPVIEELLLQISSICSIYHKTPEEMVKLYGISTQSGMISRATKDKLAKAVEYQAERKNATPVEATETKKEKKKEKKDKQKSGKMDDSSSEDDKKATEAKKEGQIDSGTTTQPAPAEVNLIDDLLGMGSQPTQQPVAQPSFGGIDLLGNMGGDLMGQQPTQQNVASGGNDFLTEMMGGGAPATQQQQPPMNLMNEAPAFGGDGMFPSDNNAGQNDNDGGADWAGGFGDDGFGGEATKEYTLDFAKAPLTEVLSSSTGGKQKKSGLQVNAAINYSNEKKQLLLELEFRNESGGAISDFDVMINKNSFGVMPDGPTSKHGITYPGPFETSDVQFLPLKIDKKNADVKNPPKHPFMLQIALKSTLDIFYFNVPCNLHCLINFAIEPAMRLTQDDFKKFWDMIQPDKTFSLEFNPSGPLKPYQGFKTLPGDMSTCLSANGFCLISQNQNTMYFGSKTVNNLPLMFEVTSPGQLGGPALSYKITYKVPVLPLKPLFEDCLKFLLSERADSS